MEKKFIHDLDFAACKECGYCSLVCRKNIFQKGSEFNQKGYRPFQVVNPETCIGCRKCFFVCPDFAISLSERRYGDETTV